MHGLLFLVALIGVSSFLFWVFNKGMNYLDEKYEWFDDAVLIFTVILLAVGVLVLIGVAVVSGHG